MIQKAHNAWINFGYKHTTLAIIIALATVLAIDTAFIAAILEWFQGFGYFGGFLGGVMLVSSFLSAPGAVLILAVSDSVHTLPLVLIATCGSVIGDWIILRFIQDDILVEMRPLARKLQIKQRLAKLQKSKLRHLTTVLGAFFVMLPTPDELGLTLMGIGHLKRYKILIICFILDFIGIYSLVTLGRNLL